MLGKARAEYSLGVPSTSPSRRSKSSNAAGPTYQSAEGHLLYAIALEKAGRDDEALANYEDVGRHYPGSEPRVRQALLLQRLGRRDEARSIAGDVARSLGRAPEHVRRKQAQWLAAARQIAGV